MPIYQSNTFWNYVCNESELVTTLIKDNLTKLRYDFDLKQTESIRYYQVLYEMVIDDIKYTYLRFPAGLTKYIQSKVGVPLITRPSTKVYTENEVLLAAEEVKSINPAFEIRPYQTEAVLTSLNQFQSLIESAVGSGKTSMMCLLCKMLVDDKILILNDNNFILQQIYERLLSFGMTDISWNPSKEPDYTKQIVLLNTSSSDSRLNSQNIEYLSFLKEVNTIIYDECQHVQALTFFEPIFYTDFDKLHRIVGYSGSPFRNYKSPYQDLDDFRTIAILGEPAFVYKMKDTVSDGNIAQPYGYFINFKNEPGNVPDQFADSYFMQYRANITYNKNRNAAGLEMLKFLDKHGIKTLASYNNIKPGQKMMKSLAEQGIKALFICGDETIYEWKPTKRGSLKLEERKGTPKDVRKALEEDGYNIIFGSTVLDEGVDIDIFQAAVLFSAGKTPIAGIQRIGRASRKKKDGMNVSLVIDFKDEGGYYVFQEHYNRRKQMMYDSGVKIFTNVLDFINLVKEISENKK